MRLRLDPLAPNGVSAVQPPRIIESHSTSAGAETPAAGSNQHTITREQVGPSSYPTGGFEIDLTATYSSLNFLDLVVKKGSRGSLPPADLNITLNSPSNGKAKVKLMRKRYDKVSAIGNVQNQPSGVIVRSTNAQVGSSEATHTHTIDHDHPSVTSDVPTPAGGTTLTDALGPTLQNHTHTLNLPNLQATSGAGGSHNHQDNTIYQHGHFLNQTETNLALTEIANLTDLSTTTWYMISAGVSL